MKGLVCKEKAMHAKTKHLIVKQVLDKVHTGFSRVKDGEKADVCYSL